MWPGLVSVTAFSSRGYAKLKIANSLRITGYEEHNNLPNMCFVRRFATRHSLTLRKSLEISKGRAICSVADLKIGKLTQSSIFWRVISLLNASVTQGESGTKMRAVLNVASQVSFLSYIIKNKLTI